MTAKTTAEIIRIARQRAGLSQAQLARRLDVYQQDVSRWERGDVEPKASIRDRIVEICEMHVLRVRREDGGELEILYTYGREGGEDV